MGRSVGTDRFAVNRFTMLAPVVWLLSMGALLVVPFLTLSDAEVALTWPSPLSAIWWVAVATATVQAALVLLVPRVQVWAMVLVPTAGLPLAAVASWETLSITAIATIATVLVTILNADLSRLGSALAGALLATALGYVIAGLSGVEMPPALIALSSLGQALVVVAVPAGAAAIVLTRREARRARESEQAALVRERDARAESAVARERTALARELHDIAAHHMSGIAVM
ncbi:MAG: histidine kinase dimerization/phosphoacceptor domain-containing protein, partial [Brevibacterium sp.]|nr:histidine kinase dimerization/phosphoacceptor domain-containing protein [Brevibacterium sp.]